MSHRKLWQLSASKHEKTQIKIHFLLSSSPPLARGLFEGIRLEGSIDGRLDGLLENFIEGRLEGSINGPQEGSIDETGWETGGIH